MHGVHGDNDCYSRTPLLADLERAQERRLFLRSLELAVLFKTPSVTSVRLSGCYTYPEFGAGVDEFELDLLQVSP